MPKFIIEVPAELWRRVRARAEQGGHDLHTVMLRWLGQYADAGTPEDTGKQGGAARAKRMTKEERSAAAQKAAQARWGKRQDDQ